MLHVFCMIVINTKYLCFSKDSLKELIVDRARRDLDKDSFESKGQNFGCVVEVILQGAGLWTERSQIDMKQ
jgi:hypothetical protein